MRKVFTFYRGRVGLYALLKALGIGRGDEVALQAFTCVAVPEGILATGAKPLYVDIEPGGYNQDAADLEKRLTHRTRAVVVQHTFGMPANMDRIVTVASRRKVAVIEDCCHTHGSVYGGKVVGSHGVGAFYSYEWGKPVVLGLGGSLRVNQSEVAERLAGLYAGFRYPGALRALRVTAQTAVCNALLTPSRYWILRGLFRMSAGLGLAEGNYNRVEPWKEPAADFSLRMIRSVERRLFRDGDALASAHASHSRHVVAGYRRVIDGRGVVHPPVSIDSGVIYARYPLLVNDKVRLLELARRKKVELAGWYATPVHPLVEDEWGLVGYEGGMCPEAEMRAAMVVSLPTYPKVSAKDIDRCGDLFSAFCRG